MSETTILDEIVAHKHKEIEHQKHFVSLESIKSKARDSADLRDFSGALKSTGPSVIAEIKRASPSRGLIREDFEPAEIAKSYEQCGADCLSVLTDERFFQGSSAALTAAREVVDLPVLRKDFIVDEYQIYETRAMPADCVLLIEATLGRQQLKDYFSLATSLGLCVLVEVHDESELSQAIDIKASLVGINNRNLKTFETDLEVTERLAPLAPNGTLLVSESGIHTRADITRIQRCGVSAFLVGEAFMRKKDPGRALRELFFSE